MKLIQYTWKFKINIRKQFSHKTLSPFSPHSRYAVCSWGDEKCSIMYILCAEYLERERERHEAFNICEWYFAWLRNMTPRCGNQMVAADYMQQYVWNILGHSLRWVRLSIIFPDFSSLMILLKINLLNCWLSALQLSILKKPITSIIKLKCKEIFGILWNRIKL